MATVKELIQAHGGVKFVPPKSNSNTTAAKAAASEPPKPESSPVSTPSPSAEFNFEAPTVRKNIPARVPALGVRKLVREKVDKYKQDIRECLPDYIRRIAEIDKLNPSEDDFFLERLTERAELESEIEAQVSPQISVEDPLREPFRIRAVMVFAEAWAENLDPADTDKVKKFLTKLVEIGFWETTTGGSDSEDSRRFFGRSFVLTKRTGFLSEAQVVLSKIGRLVSNAYAAESQRRSDIISNLAVEVARQPITTEELETGAKNGRIFLEVPPRTLGARSHPGGKVAFEVYSGKAKVLGAVGGLEKSAMEIKKAGVFFPVGLVFRGELEGIKVVPGQEWMIAALRSWLRGGILEAKRKEEVERKLAEQEAARDAKREALREKATLENVKFFKGNVGTMLFSWVDYSSISFELTDPDGRVVPIPASELFFLVKRERKGMISVPEYPEWLEKYLGPYAEPREASERFSNLGVLGVMLRAACTALTRAGKIKPTPKKGESSE